MKILLYLMSLWYQDLKIIRYPVSWHTMLTRFALCYRWFPRTTRSRLSILMWLSGPTADETLWMAPTREGILSRGKSSGMVGFNKCQWKKNSPSMFFVVIDSLNTPMHEPSYSAVFDHGRDPILIQRINKRVLTAFFTTLSFHLFVHPSFSLFVLVQYTHRHGPDASLPGRACSII